MTRSYVGIGSNLGEREFLIREAEVALRELPRTSVIQVSSLYDTDPVGDIEQPPFLNAVVRLETELEARELLWHLLLIEKRMGRVRTQRWDGKYPLYYMGGGGGAGTNLLLNVPAPDHAHSVPATTQPSQGG